MKFSLSILTAFAAAVMAQTSDFDPVTQPLSNQEIPAGKPFEIVWQAPAKYAAGTVALELIGGKDQGSQVPISKIAAGIPNSALKYTWNVDASLGDANVYGIVIRWEADPKIFQYSNPFHIKKAAAANSAADTTTTISKSYGVKTVTLSHCDCEETSMVTPPAISTPTPTPTPIRTTTYVKPTTIQTKPVQTTVPAPPTQTTGAATVPTGAGARFGASSAALVGAFIVAAFAL